MSSSNTISRDLPRGLHDLQQSVGLHFLSGTDPDSVFSYPIVCAGRLPILDDRDGYLRFPLQTNFVVEQLDMDKPDDVLEYRNIMCYSASGYGMRIIHLDRKYIKRGRTVGAVVRHRIVKRIYVEYYAPYRVVSGLGD
jgi:hypothetical protein